MIVEDACEIVKTLSSLFLICIKDRASNSLSMFVYAQRPSIIVPVETPYNRSPGPGLHEVRSQSPHACYVAQGKCQFPLLQSADYRSKQLIGLLYM